MSKYIPGPLRAVYAWVMAKALRARLVAGASVAMGSLALASAGLGNSVAGATTCDPTTDPTCGAASTFESSIATFVTSNLVPILAGLLFVGVGVALFVRYAKKSVKASS